jgi:hypothetical protein
MPLPAPPQLRSDFGGLSASAACPTNGVARTPRHTRRESKMNYQPIRWAVIVATLAVVASCSDPGEDSPTAGESPESTGLPATSDPPLPADQPTSLANDTAVAEAEQVVTGFLDAYGAFDADQALTYLADGAIADMSGLPAAATTEDEFRLLLALLEAQGYKETVTGCAPPAESSSGTIVRCSYDFHGIRSDEMGLGPYSDNYWELTTRDGKIVSATNTIAFMTNGFSEQVWEPFAQWVATTYPDDVERMYDNASQTQFRLSEESTQLWDQRTQEYVAAEG